MQLSSAPHDHKMPSLMDGVMSKVQLDKHMDAESAKKIWDEFDTDKSGSLDAKEVQKFIAKFCEVQGIESSDASGITDAFMAAFDVDKNGSLSFAEMTGTTAMKFVARQNAPDKDVVKYKTYEKDASFGKDFPSLDSVKWLTEDKGFTAQPKGGRPLVVLVWAKYCKPSYRYMPKYSALHACFRHHVDFAAISLDPAIADAERWVSKYQKDFPCTFALGFDEKAALKGPIASMQCTTIAIPTMYLVDAKGKVVWRQDHSQIGATANDWMDQVERQVGLLLQGDALESNGPNPAPVDDDDDDDDDDEDEDAGDGAEVDLF